MRRRHFMLGAGIVLFALALFACLLAYNPWSPAIQGRRLTAWIDDFDIWQGPATPAARALTAAGSRSEPLLVRMLEKRDTTLRSRIRRWLFRQYGIRISFRPASAIHQRALDVCNLLGKDAGRTAPAVTRLVSDFPTPSANNSIAEYALNTLAVLGSNGIPGLVQTLTNRNASLRLRAAQLLGTAPGSGSEEVLQALQANLKGPDAVLRQTASAALELLRKRFPARPPFPLNLPEEAGAIPTAGPLSLWDYTRGVKITSNSGLYPGCRAEDLFGARLSSVGTPETGSAIFQDSTPDGFVHFFEWETPAPVTLRAFGLIAGHETALSSFIRACRGFKLYARLTSDGPYSLLSAEDLTVPYGSGYCGALLTRFINLDQAVSAQQFRVEFIQNGSGIYHGTRAIELYGFDAPLTRPLILHALGNQEPVVRDLVLRLLPYGIRH